jgi:hypothetical protein
LNHVYINRPLYKLLWLCFAGAAPAFAMAALEQKNEIPVTALTTVEELLQLESRAALDTARRQVFGISPGSISAASPSDRPVLVAIYGMGRNLSAEVLIDGRLVIFYGASKKPVSGIANGYGLERIAPPCIYLTKDQSQEITCLEISAP